MKTHLEYKSFNGEKSIEELQYNMQKQIERLHCLQEDLIFLQFLISADIYKSKIINLFENLEQIKKELSNGINTYNRLIAKANAFRSQIFNKVECNDLECDNYFITTLNDLEQHIHQFSNKMEILKLEIFNYLQSVIQCE